MVAIGDKGIHDGMEDPTAGVSGTTRSFSSNEVTVDSPDTEVVKITAIDKNDAMSDVSKDAFHGGSRDSTSGVILDNSNKLISSETVPTNSDHSEAIIPVTHCNEKGSTLNDCNKVVTSASGCSEVGTSVNDSSGVTAISSCSEPVTSVKDCIAIDREIDATVVVSSEVVSTLTDSSATLIKDDSIERSTSANSCTEAVSKDIESNETQKMMVDASTATETGSAIAEKVTAEGVERDVSNLAVNSSNVLSSLVNSPDVSNSAVNSSEVLKSVDHAMPMDTNSSDNLPFHSAPSSFQGPTPSPQVLAASGTPENLATAVPKTSLVPVGSQMRPSSLSPGKALTSLVVYELSSDSDSSMESDDDSQKVPPARAVVKQQQSQVTSSECITEALPPAITSTNGHCNNNGSSNGDDVLLVDISSNDYRYTIDIGSATEDSESDSESSCSSSSLSSPSSGESSSEEEDSAVKMPPKETQTENKPQKERGMSKKKRNGLLTPGELSIEDLPPIEDLKISVPEDQAHVIGYILNIVERQVVVQGHHGIPPIDLDSVLFLDKGNRVLGQIFDVFGRVQEPLYVVRFNSSDHVKEHQIKKGEPVFYAPSTEHTSFIVIDELMRMKGSDASGLTGNEPLSSEVSDFSDDEEEARAKGISKPSKFNSSSEFQPGRKRIRHHGSSGSAEGRGSGRGRGCRGGRSTFNPFSERGNLKQRNHHNPSGPLMQQKFNPRNPGGSSSRFSSRPCGPMQNHPFPMDNGDFGSRPFSPYAGQFDMNGSLGHDNKPHYGCPNHPGPPQSPMHWSQPSSQFGGPPQFPNQRFGFPPPNNVAPPTPPPPPSPHSYPPPCPLSFSPRPPSHPSAEFYNSGPPGAPTPPAPPIFSPRPPDHSCIQNMAPPRPPNQFGYQNVGPQSQMPCPPTPMGPMSPMPCSPSFSPQPPHPPPVNFQNMGPPSVPPYPPASSPRPPQYGSPGFTNMPPPAPSPLHNTGPPPAPHPHPPPPPGAGTVNGEWYPPGPGAPPFSMPPPDPSAHSGQPPFPPMVHPPPAPYPPHPQQPNGSMYTL